MREWSALRSFPAASRPRMRSPLFISLRHQMAMNPEWCPVHPRCNGHRRVAVRLLSKPLLRSPSQSSAQQKTAPRAAIFYGGGDGTWTRDLLHVKQATSYPLHSAAFGYRPLPARLFIDHSILWPSVQAISGVIAVTLPSNLPRHNISPGRLSEKRRFTKIFGYLQRAVGIVTKQQSGSRTPGGMP